MRADPAPPLPPDPLIPPPPRSSALLIACFAAVYVIWGSTYLALRIGVQTIPPFLLGGCRFLLAGAVLYATARRLGSPHPRAEAWRAPVISGLLMLTAGNGLVAWAEQRVPSSTAALLIAAVPLWVVLFEWARPGGNRPTRAQLVGIGVGGGGLALLISPTRAHASGAASVSPAGLLAVLGSGLAWAAGTVYTRHVVARSRRTQSSALFSGQQMLAGGAGLLAMAALTGEMTPAAVARVSARSAFAFAYLTVLGSIVAFSAYGYLVRVSSPALVSTTAYVNPVVAVVLGWLILDERLAPRTLAGAGVTIAAVAVMTFGGRRAPWARLKPRPGGGAFPRT